jgi:hypothetical protein
VVAIAEASRHQPAVFQVAWHPLLPVTGEPVFGKLPTGVRLVAVRGGKGDSTGILAEFAVDPPGPLDNQLFFDVRPQGIDPEPPPVPVRIDYPALVVIEPAGIVELRRAAAETDHVERHAQARVTVQFAAELGEVRLRNASVQPTVSSTRIEAKLHDLGPRSHAIELRLQPGADRSLQGTLVLDTDHADLTAIRVPWVYLGRSVAKSE